MVSEPNLPNRILAVIAAIADVGAVSSLVAEFLRQDTYLVLAIVFVTLSSLFFLTWLLQRGHIDHQNRSVLIVVVLISIVIAIVFWASLASVKVTPIQIEILSPLDGEKIDGYRYVVKGTVSDPSSRVYVVARSLISLDYWVQEPPTVDTKGNWQVNAYLGEERAGIGEGYEITASATNENFLVTCMTGNCLQVGKTKNIPTKTNRSNLVTVTRIR